MNRLELIPQDAPDFAFIRRMEQLSRCHQFASSQRICQQQVKKAIAAELPETEKNARLSYLALVIRKLQHQHRETHLCYPFSLN